MRTKTKFILAFALCVGLFIGCAHLDKGADPLIVRAEQIETVADSAFDSVVKLDSANRQFWLTNAPAFHSFAEWLRTPVPVGTNTVRRGIAMVQQLNYAKLDYRQNHSQSNLLISLTMDLQNALSQAQAWTVIISNPKTH